MIKLKAGQKLVVASHNHGKVLEINDLIGPYGVKAVSAADLDLPEPEEIGKTFAENAVIKAQAAARAAGLPALSDDSGLAVDALGGDPGIYSARWAGPDKDFTMAMRNVEEALQGKGATTLEQRCARFVCALCLALPDGITEVFEGTVRGHLTWPPRGTKGFGYDPMFVPGGHDMTFGEMVPKVKHSISHRARAFEMLVLSAFEA